MSECMTLFFGGHDSGAHSMTWALLLLAQHPEWQEKARAEARMVLGDGLPTKESVSQLKVVSC
jgi:cytokinin trans-hydroxylase